MPFQSGAERTCRLEGGIPWGLGDSGMEEVAFEHLYFDKVVFELLV